MAFVGRRSYEHRESRFEVTDETPKTWSVTLRSTGEIIVGGLDRFDAERIAGSLEREDTTIDEVKAQSTE